MRHVVVFAVLLAGCTGHAVPPPTPMSTAPAADVSYGVVVGERPALPGGMRTAILAALGAPVTATAPVNVTEFIVRADDGQTLSVVQADTAGLRPGERVTIRAGERTLLVRPAHAGQALPGG